MTLLGEHPFGDVLHWLVTSQVEKATQVQIAIPNYKDVRSIVKSKNQAGGKRMVQEADKFLAKFGTSHAYIVAVNSGGCNNMRDCVLMFDQHQIPINPDHVAGMELFQRELVQAGDLGNDAAHGGNGLAGGIEDGGGGCAAVLQSIKGIRADGRALAGGEYQHLPGDGLSLQLVAAFDHHAGLRVYPAKEGDGLGGDQCLAAGMAGEDEASGEGGWLDVEWEHECLRVR